MTSLEVIFFIDVVTAAIAIFTLVTLLKIAVHAKAAEKQTTSYLSDFKEGLYILSSMRF